MSHTVTEHAQRDREGGEGVTDWDALFPPDPDLMTSAEGDTKGLAELQRAARTRLEGVSGG